MRRYTLLIPAILLLTACSSTTTGSTLPSAGSTASCETALVAQLRNGIANPNAPTGTKPAACDGLADAVITQLAEQAMTTVFGNMASSTALPTSFPTSG